MRIPVYIAVSMHDDEGQQLDGGFMTHVITLSNEVALERLIEHFQGQALDNIPLLADDCLVYDDELD